MVETNTKKHKGSHSDFKGVIFEKIPAVKRASLLCILRKETNLLHSTVHALIWKTATALPKTGKSIIDTHAMMVIKCPSGSAIGYTITAIAAIIGKLNMIAAKRAIKPNAKLRTNRIRAFSRVMSQLFLKSLMLAVNAVNGSWFLITIKMTSGTKVR